MAEWGQDQGWGDERSEADRREVKCGGSGWGESYRWEAIGTPDVTVGAEATHLTRGKNWRPEVAPGSGRHPCPTTPELHTDLSANSDL